MSALLLLVIGILTVVLGFKLPPDVKLCHKSDPNFAKCLGKSMEDALKSFANGDENLGVSQLDPFFLEKLTLESANSQIMALRNIYRNAHIYGMTDSHYTNTQIDIEKGCKLVYDVTTPNIRLEGDYELTGNLMMFSLNAHGKCNVTLHNLDNRHTLTCEKYMKRNKTHLRVTNYTMDMKPERLSYEFEDIFPENQEIAAAILKTINDNSVAMFKEIKAGFQQAFCLIHANEANRLFSKIPMDEIFLE